MTRPSSPARSAPGVAHAAVAGIRLRVTYWEGHAKDPDDFDAFYKAARHRLLAADLRAHRRPAGRPQRGARRVRRTRGTTGARSPGSRTPSPGSGRTPGSTPSAGTPPASGTATSPSTPSSRATLDALAKLTLDPAPHPAADPARHDLDGGDGTRGRPDRRGRPAAAPAGHRPVRDPPRGALEPGSASTCRRSPSSPTDARFPRPSIIRRAGATRRRLHTAIGVGATVVALLPRRRRGPRGRRRGPRPDRRQRPGSERDREPRTAAETLRLDNLLTPEQAAELSRAHTFGEAGPSTTPRATGSTSSARRTATPTPTASGPWSGPSPPAASPGLSATPDRRAVDVRPRPPSGVRPRPSAGTPAAATSGCSCSPACGSRAPATTGGCSCCVPGRTRSRRTPSAWPAPAASSPPRSARSGPRRRPRCRRWSR